MKRRQALVAIATMAVAGVGTLGYLQTRRPAPTLLSEGVVYGSGGVLYPVPVGQPVEYEPGTRVPSADWDEPWMQSQNLSSAERAALLSELAEHTALAHLPDDEWQDLRAQALADLLALTGPILASPTDAGGYSNWAYPEGAVIAAPVLWWRYIWPRDAAFAAAAFAAVGLQSAALAVLEQLATVQHADGSFEARYTADGVSPDERARQNDGPGWVLWATKRVLDSSDDPDEDRQRVEGMLSLCTDFLLQVTDTVTGLPPAGADYWELPEDTLTLGLAAPVLLGLESAAALELHPDCESRSTALRLAIETAFAPQWGRHMGKDDVDSALCFLAPPFTVALAGVEQVRAGLCERLARPAGGVAPGSSWREDGVSWTPQTALLAWSAAALELGNEATSLLEWLEQHRTLCGALPEKVLADGAPAGPAPLAWTAALVLLALSEKA